MKRLFFYFNQCQVHYIVNISYRIVNPVTGEVIGQPGTFFTPGRDSTPAQPVKRSNRIPPGGFSTPLW